MPSITITFGVLLIALGGGLYGTSEPERRSFTALIPALFGIVLIIAGAIARNDKARKHAMHLAAAVGLIGCLAGLIRGTMAYFAETVNHRAAGGQVAMGVLCGVFVVLCVKSFIDVRKARKAAEAGK